MFLELDSSFWLNNASIYKAWERILTFYGWLTSDQILRYFDILLHTFMTLE
jgi:hypothetical protein